MPRPIYFDTTRRRSVDIPPPNHRESLYDDNTASLESITTNFDALSGDIASLDTHLSVLIENFTSSRTFNPFKVIFPH
jgi:hypothetical protein